MNRRDLLTTFFKQAAAAKKQEILATTVTASLDPYDGPFEFQQAKHLLRRTTYAPTKEFINQAVDMGLEMTLDTLLEDLPPQEPPIRYSLDNGVGSNIPVGETWVNEPYDPGTQGQRKLSVYYWLYSNKYTNGIHIRQKMWSFWSTHFVAMDINTDFLWEAAFGQYSYAQLMYDYSLGDFKELTKKMTVEAMMLIYLGGHENYAAAPNENYARELLELFTLGKGPLVETAPDEPIDYTHYTEKDVQEIAKALTGWKASGLNGGDFPSAYFVPENHDDTTKTLSHRFDNQQIEGNGAEEYKDVIDLIFEREECAKHLCRRLYRFFLYHDITDDIELNIIEPMAQILRDNDYVVKPALRALLGSQHFFDSLYMGAMLKSTIEFRTCFHKQVRNGYKYIEPGHLGGFGYVSMIYMKRAQTSVLYPPNVGGWPAYYLSPIYYQWWYNATTLQIAQEDVGFIFAYAHEGHIGFLSWLESLENPSDIEAVVTELTCYFWPCPISIERRDEIVNIVMNGLPPFEWGVEYGLWQDGTNSSTLINEKMTLLLRLLVSYPEFYMN